MQKKNLIFLTMVPFRTILERGIYTDLLRKFHIEGYHVYVVFPKERRLNEATTVEEQDGAVILGVKTLNLQKSSIIEKGIGQVLVEIQYKRALKKYLSNVQFDLILYSTPPVTFNNVISFLKEQNPQAKTFLLLKDIFPQNAIDIGLMSKTGLKGFLYRFFRKKEKKLYAISNNIGCMSPANVEYILEHNPEIDSSRVGVAPNSIDINAVIDSDEKDNKKNIREKYGLPLDKPIFIYGGNLGKPQGVAFLIDCLAANASRKDCFFVVVGTGTELPKLQSWYVKANPLSVKVMDGLPKSEYDELVKSCDVGLIFLDHRFTIPNYPSRLLSYLENKMPVLCATDPNCDMGYIAEGNGYGYWCESNSVEAFTNILEKMISSDRKTMGKKGYEFLCKNYLVQNTYDAITKHND